MCLVIPPTLVKPEGITELKKKKKKRRRNKKNFEKKDVGDEKRRIFGGSTSHWRLYIGIRTHL